MCGPMQLAGDPVARLVEMANRGLGHALADRLVDRGATARAFLSAQVLVHPGDDAGRADRRGAEQIAQSLRDAILGDELLDIEIDRRRLDALAILGRRDDALRKRRLCLPSAMPATIDRGPMFGDQQRALGNVEHLPLLVSCRRARIERRTTTAASAGLMPNHRVGIRPLAAKSRPRALSGRRSACRNDRADCP